VLRVLAADLDLASLRPKRLYRRNRYFARNELSRLCLSVLRTAAGELLSTDDIAGRVIAGKWFDIDDGILRSAIRSGQSSSGYTATALSRRSVRDAGASGRRQRKSADGYNMLW
jgi:hypothetical protein